MQAPIRAAHPNFVACRIASDSTVWFLHHVFISGGCGLMTDWRLDKKADGQE